MKEVFLTLKSSKEASPLGQSFGPSTFMVPLVTIGLNGGNGPMIVHNMTN